MGWSGFEPISLYQYTRMNFRFNISKDSIDSMFFFVAVPFGAGMITLIHSLYRAIQCDLSLYSNTYMLFVQEHCFL